MGIFSELMNQPSTSVATPSLPDASKTAAEVVSGVSEPKPKQNTPNASNIARQQTSKLDSNNASKLSVEYILRQKPLETQGVRFPSELVELMEDVINDIRKKYKQRLNKQEICVTAVSDLLVEYQEKGESSSLYKYLLKSLLAR